MMSPRITSPIEEEGADVDGVDRGGAKWVGGAVDLDCLDLNCALLHLTVVASMTHMKVKWSDTGK